MSGYRKDGAQAVYIAGSANNAVNIGGTNPLLITPVGDHTRNASVGTAVTLTPPAGANFLQLSIEAQPVRVRYDGGAATTTVGFLYVNGDQVSFLFSPGVTFSVIETTTSAVIQYQWGTV